MARLRQIHGEEGMTLVEVLMVSILMIVVLGATLTALESFERNTATNMRQNEAQDQARRAMDMMARDLRNLASPIRERPEAVDLALPTDVVFQSEGKEMGATSLNARNTERVRFCLDADGRLWRAIQTWESAVIPDPPSTEDCPGDGWTRDAIVAENVVNGERPIFTYNATDYRDITEVSATVYVDVNPGVRPSEVTLQSSVYLRNQNREPSAVFSVDVLATGSILLNASESTDPEEKAMIYTWKVDGVEVGHGILLTWPVDPGAHEVTLEVSDGVLPDEASQNICVPAPALGVTCP
jgi:type II secretory pathway pseudopilin PulG